MKGNNHTEKIISELDISSYPLFLSKPHHLKKKKEKCIDMLLFEWVSVDSELLVSQSSANVVLLKYLTMVLCCFDIFLKENTSDKKSGPREFREQSLHKLQWICSAS